MESKPKYKKHDVVHPYGVITRISDYFVWFGQDRYRHKTLENKVIHFQKSPNTVVDWTNEKAVDDYYKSFNMWSTAVRMGDERHAEILEIKNNKIFKDGEYYLPFTYKDSMPCKENYADGMIWGFVIKKTNAWYDTMEGEIVNIFMVTKELSADYIRANEEKDIFKKELSTLEYLHAINAKHLNNDDLRLFRENLPALLMDNFKLPYISKHKKPVTVSIGRDFGDVIVSHRNRKAFFKIENGYYGGTPYKNDYYLILEAAPYFTNEMQYYVRVERDEITWDKKMLDILANRVVKVWDKAIENNASNRYM